MITRLAIKELWASRRQLGIPVLALALAVGSLFVLNALQFRVEELLKSEARNSMGADVEIDSLQPVGADEMERVRAILPASARISELKDFNTMMRVPGTTKARFVRAQVIEKGFPFYGEFELEPQRSFDDLDSTEPTIFIPASVASVFELQVGDLVSVGRTSFRIEALILKRPGALGAALRFAPSVYFHDKFLESTDLMSRPGRVDYEQLIFLPNEKASSWVKPIKSSLNEGAYEVRAFDSDDRGFAEVFDQFKLFGQIVGLAALLIASFSIFGSFQTWFRDRKFLVAILRSTGASRAQIRWWMYSAVLVLSMLASAIGLGLGVVAEALLSPQLQSVIQFSTESTLPFDIYIAVFVIGVLMTLLFSLLAMAEVEHFKPLILIRPEIGGFSLRPQKTKVAALIVASFFIFAWYFTAKLELASYITLGLLVLLLLALGFNSLLFYLLHLTARSRSFIWRYAVRSTRRELRSSLTNASLLFLIASSLGVVICLENALMREFEVDENTPASTFFIFDMGDEDKEQVTEFLKEFPDMQANWLPSLTLRWVGWNGEDPYVNLDENYYDQEIRMMVINELPKSNFIVDGKAWTGLHQEGSGPVGVSIAKNYAFVRGIDVGDSMKFELYGVEFEAIVQNLRAVRLLDFRPNSRFMFQKGFFEGLPFNWYASLESKSGGSYDLFMKTFFEQFQTISLIDLSEVRKDLIDLILKLRQAIFFILMFLVVVSVSLLAAFAREKVSTRQLEMATLKCFGASKAQLMGIIALEFAILALLPSLAGALLAYVTSQIILVQAFTIFLSPWTMSLLLIPFVTLILVELVGLLGSLRLFSLKPKLLLSDH